LSLSLSTGRSPYRDGEAVGGGEGGGGVGYEVLIGESVELVADADAYAQEGALTTFFRGRGGRAVLDSWARRLASYRTADIVRIRWLGEPRDPALDETVRSGP
jgi:hypothetical protein